MTLNNGQNQIGVLGATSSVGLCLLESLVMRGGSVKAFSRRDVLPDSGKTEWRKLTTDVLPHQREQKEGDKQSIPHWICLSPIASLPAYFALLESYGVKRIVAVSSTSRYTKNNSSDFNEQLLALNLAKAEATLQEWAEKRDIEWIILRPTLIYGLGRDKNISEIARFIYRFGLFPLFSNATGLRQPVHAEDVAEACLLALNSPASTNHAYNISGAEIVTYREMVVRIFLVMGKRPHFFSIPLWLFGLAVKILRLVPRYQKWSTAMAERMNYDMVFDHSEAERDFGFKPRDFRLTLKDLP